MCIVCIRPITMDRKRKQKKDNQRFKDASKELLIGAKNVLTFSIFVHIFPTEKNSRSEIQSTFVNQTLINDEAKSLFIIIVIIFFIVIVVVIVESEAISHILTGILSFSNLRSATNARGSLHGIVYLVC